MSLKSGCKDTSYLLNKQATDGQITVVACIWIVYVDAHSVPHIL